MATLPHAQTSEQFLRNVADLYGDRDPAPTASTLPAWRQVVAQVNAELCAKLRLDVPTPRLQKALELVLAHAVTLHQDGSASVLSGKQTYTLAPHCPCPDAKNRTELCKHALAVELHRRALALLDGTAHAPATNASVPAPPVATPPPTVPTSAAWQVQEAPTSACFKWRIGQAELMYTFRGVTDDEVLARIREHLPLLQDILDACETRAAERAAARDAALAQAHQAQTPTTPVLTPEALQALHALLTPPAARNGAANGHQTNGYTPPRCPAHGDLRESTKEPGTWFCTHKLSDGSYCKTKA